VSLLGVAHPPEHEDHLGVKPPLLAQLQRRIQPDFHRLDSRGPRQICRLVTSRQFGSIEAHLPPKVDDVVPVSSTFATGPGVHLKLVKTDSGFRVHLSKGS